MTFVSSYGRFQIAANKEAADKRPGMAKNFSRPVYSKIKELGSLKMSTRKIFGTNGKTMLLTQEGIVVATNKGLDTISWSKLCDLVYSTFRKQSAGSIHSPLGNFRQYTKKVALAAETGVWTTGAKIKDFGALIDNVKRRWEALTPADFENVDDKTVDALMSISAAINNDDAYLSSIIDEIVLYRNGGEFGKLESLDEDSENTEAAINE